MKAKGDASAGPRESRKRARHDLAADVSPSVPGTTPPVLPVVVDWDLGAVTKVLRGAEVILIDHALIERESPKLHRLIRRLSEILSEQSCVAVNAVSVANLRLGHHDPTKAAESKRTKAMPRDDALWRRAAEMLGRNRRLSYAELARRIIEKYPDEDRKVSTLKEKLAALLGR